MLLRDLGATVIKVEGPTGKYQRLLGEPELDLIVCHDIAGNRVQKGLFGF